jgi:hypothetical protein
MAHHFDKTKLMPRRDVATFGMFEAMTVRKTRNMHLLPHMRVLNASEPGSMTTSW